MSATLPIVAFVEEEESVDILQLAGASSVFALKVQLGEYLATRVDAGGGRSARHSSRTDGRVSL